MKPVLFETMVFNSTLDKWDDYQERYTTVESALSRHSEIVEEVKKDEEEG